MEKRTNPGHHSTLKSRGALDTIYAREELNIYSPLDIMLKLPSRALNSMSWARGTIPEASMFCTASTAIVLRLGFRIRQIESLTSSIEWHADLCNHARSTSRLPASPQRRETYHERHICGGWEFRQTSGATFHVILTYDVKRRFESAALRSLTCAFCVARNCTLS